MKKLLLGLLLISSVLSFGATQRVGIEKLVTNESRDTLYLEETKNLIQEKQKENIQMENFLELLQLKMVNLMENLMSTMKMEN